MGSCVAPFSVHGASLILTLALGIQPHLLGDRRLPRRELLLHDVAVPAAPRVPVCAVLVAHLRPAARVLGEQRGLRRHSHGAFSSGTAAASVCRPCRVPDTGSGTQRRCPRLCHGSVAFLYFPAACNMQALTVMRCAANQHTGSGALARRCANPPGAMKLDPCKLYTRRGGDAPARRSARAQTGAPP